MNQGRGSIRFFEAAGRRYVADIDTGHAVPVSDAEWHALKAACGEAESPSRHASGTRGRTETLRARGVLRLPEIEKAERRPAGERPVLFVPSAFMGLRERVDPLVNRSHYRLLTALASRADICMPMTPSDDAEEEFDFGEVGIHMLDVRGIDDGNPLETISTT